MKQNKYDEQGFFSQYSQMARSIEGLSAAGEWHVFRELLPPLHDKKVLDLGCGFGWHCRYAREQQARSVVGVDLSENMLARAREATSDPAIEYIRFAIEDIDFASEEFDVVISSLAIHYVERFDLLCQRVHHCLAPGGSFVFSVEHPVFTALAAQDWHYGPQGERLHWPVDNYQQEGIRHTNFLENEVVKYHRTFSTYMNDLIAAGFQIAKVAEPGPPEEMLDIPGMRDEVRRPIFLLIAASKQA
ncbi:class I SAM-dependent methyltransferase [Brevibacillus sp. 179-C9.3 HS]|uniref:class I SAM-dependent methyltransferase n=1 Tax=unclassified Brevibacillus TaxID=2684853 RepID=UPI0039A20A78